MVNRVGQQLGNYRLTRLLSAGGFAEVYLAEHIHLGTQAAIKILIQQLDVQKFYEEARRIARLVHPNIVRLLDFGVEDKGGTDKTPYMVMDYAPNGTLGEKYPEGTQVPLQTVVSIIRQVASALQYAHDEKIIHRDLKPDNLLIGRRNEILLSDFGIAVIAHSTRTRVTTDLIGTVTYMAPEQIEKHPTPASDQYALGVIVYEWLTGDPPFDGTVQEVLSKHLKTTPDPLRVKVPMLSPVVEQVVLKTLEKDPKQRFTNIQSFASALEQASGSYIAPATPAIILPSQTPVVTPAVTPASNAPTPPMVFSNTDELLVQQMAVSDINPYASWGKLVVNGSKDKVIEERTDNSLFTYDGQPYYSYSGMYHGNIFHQSHTCDKDYLPSGIGAYINALRDYPFENFTFQALQRKSKASVRGGLALLGDNKAKVYYAFVIYEDDKTSGKYAVMNEVGEEIRSGACSAIHRSEANLLAIVAQEPGILDIYINLVHVLRMFDGSFANGCGLGVFLFGSYGTTSVSTSHVKVWVK